LHSIVVHVPGTVKLVQLYIQNVDLRTFHSWKVYMCPARGICL